MSFLKKAIIILALLIVIVAVFFFYFYMPASEDLTAAKEEFRELQAQRMKLENRAKAKDQFLADKKRVEERLQQLLTKLPNDRDVNAILKEFESLATVLGIDITGFTIQPETNKGFYSEIPITLDLEGRYHDIAIFFDKISKTERIINFTDLEIATPREVEGVMLVKTKCTATAYRFNAPTGGGK